MAASGINGDQGDEYHYVLVCPSLMEERSKYIKRYFRIRPNYSENEPAVQCTQCETADRSVQIY